MEKVLNSISAQLRLIYKQLCETANKPFKTVYAADCANLHSVSVQDTILMVVLELMLGY